MNDQNETTATPAQTNDAGSVDLQRMDREHENPICPCGKPMIRSTGGWTCRDEFTAWALMEPVGGHGAQGEVLPTEKALPQGGAKKGYDEH